MFIDRAANHAARMTRVEYESAGHTSILSYDLARMAATDRGLRLCRNVDIDTTPDNPWAALLKMFDDKRAALGAKRQHEKYYQPRETVTGDD